ncbi:hypothetical protein SAMN05444156_0328 [Verrucomicrobium sp. GAS474]|uniref:hypothetical protein n=1 Tax=Verrucomicrobium sp. GAS474 TaxID=1882831 RepID=UPI00087D523C|nr:hypothetical protein [Verrucomicrobium sp. GAS474]SDT87627.1 hypothetical protein SAMN05444156_0328 [Verrucomicrobium sp. GAS474]
MNRIENDSETVLGQNAVESQVSPLVGGMELRRRMGRPPKPVEHVRRHLVALRVTTLEKQMLQDFAASNGKAFSDWARPILLAALREERRTGLVA